MIIHTPNKEFHYKFTYKLRNNNNNKIKITHMSIFLREKQKVQKPSPAFTQDYIDQINKINETGTLDSNLYNLIVKFKTMTGKTIEML